MKIWILQTGEPLDIDNDDSRPMRAMNLSSYLVNKGHRVVLWSSAFHHRDKRHRSKEYKIYNVSKEYQIRLIPSPGYKENISLKRFWDHIIMGRNLKKILKKEIDTPDVAFIGFPPIEVASIMGDWLNKKNIPYLVDIKDQWPDFFLESLNSKIRFIGKIILFPLFIITKKIFRNSTGLTAMSEQFLKWGINFSKKNNNESNLVVPLTTPLIQLEKNEYEKARIWWKNNGIDIEGINNIIFIGSHYPSLDFNPVIQAAKILKDKKIKCNFILCGFGEQTVSLKEQAKNIDNIYFPGWVNREQISVLASFSLASLTPLKNINNYMINIPNKIVDSLALGLPILSPLKGEVSNMITKHNVGLIYKEKSAESLSECIIKLIKNDMLAEKLSINSKRLYEEKFSYDLVYGRLVSHLESLAKNND